MNSTEIIRAVQNKRLRNIPGPEALAPSAVQNVRRLHRGVPGYRPTPLLSLEALAGRLGVRAVLVKDESYRFGLNAFKGLGGIYSVTQVIARELGLTPEAQFGDLQRPEYQERIGKMVFATATDGNHGRGVAWATGLFGCESHVYLPEGSAPSRVEAIRRAGPRSHACILPMGYDDAVRCTAEKAGENGWFLIQDTSSRGYEEIPRLIIEGYTTMAAEAMEQLSQLSCGTPTHVFLQAGVGSMAGAVIGYLANALEDRRPVFGIVEPEAAACFYRSVLLGDGLPHRAGPGGSTMMAGLNCLEPCPLIWPVLRDFAGWYFSCSDAVAAYGMRLLGAPLGSDPRILSGESGASAAGLFALIAGRPEYRELREKIGLGSDSVVLLFSTEGATDPANYGRVVHGGAHPLPD